MVAAISEDPLTSSNGTIPRRPKGRQVSSRYMSHSPSPSPSPSSTTTTTTSTSTSTTTSSSRRFPSPLLSHSSNSSTPPVDQHRWPARTQRVDHLSKSVDVSDKKKVIGNGFGKVVRALQQSMVVEGEKRRASFDGLGGLSLDLGKAELLKGNSNSNSNANNHSNNDGGGGGGNLVNKSSLASDLTASDTDSVSSGSTSGAHESSGAAKGTKEPRGIVVSARFWQETNSRLRRLQDPGSPLSTSPASRIGVPNRNAQLKRYNSDGPMLSPRTMASPVRGNVNARPASPSKLWAGSSPSRGVSPARVRSTVASSINSGSSNTPSILSFSADVRRGKIGEDRIFDAHTLRLLYNRYVQWRFVNARADATFMVQKLNAERHLWNAWVTISELRHSVILKRIKLVLLRQKLKLTSILKGQISYLEEWALLDRDHSSSLLGATEALKASTLRLPVVEKAIADVPNLKDALGSAVDVMQAMASSIYSLSSKVEETNCLVAEILKVTSKERLLLEHCKEFLSSLAAMQVKDCSLRTHMLQLSRVPTSSCLTTRV
ncbi:hypothetical protein glysoja_020035 [Glycine soja]|nr:hypothetical protein glysoja_020035 [Glycine soja]